MTINLQLLADHHDLLFEIPLKVRQGHRFQPTGFPDLGAAEFETASGRSLLVESAQSMANRLEAVCWDASANDLVAPLRGLSYVKVVDGSGAFLTSSVLEAHRLNSAYIEKAEPGCHDSIHEEIGKAKNRPFDRSKLVKALLRYDIGALLHGVFLESMDGRFRVARAVSAFIEADDVRVAASGGVKNDRIQPGKDDDAGRNAKEGFGNLPFPRDEYTAGAITLYASVDLAQIRGYGLDDGLSRLLIVLALFKLRAFVDSPMRLRTACVFSLDRDGSITSRNVGGFHLPPFVDLKGNLEKLVGSLTQSGTFAGKNGVTEVTFGA